MIKFGPACNGLKKSGVWGGDVSPPAGKQSETKKHTYMYIHRDVHIYNTIGPIGPIGPSDRPHQSVRPFVRPSDSLTESRVCFSINSHHLVAVEERLGRLAIGGRGDAQLAAEHDDVVLPRKERRRRVAPSKQAARGCVFLSVLWSSPSRARTAWEQNRRKIDTYMRTCVHAYIPYGTYARSIARGEEQAKERTEVRCFDGI